MTAATMQGARPPDRIRHRWRCTRTGARVETVRQLPTGEALVVLRCVECEADDLAERVRERARVPPPPPPPDRDNQRTNATRERDDDPHHAHGQHGDHAAGASGQEVGR